MSKSSNKKNKRSLKMGSYSMIITAVAIAVVVFANLFINTLPSSATKYDLTSDRTYSIGEQSEKIAKDIQDDVKIYLMAANGSEDANLKEFIQRYTSLNDKITLEQKDPVLYPNFVKEYTDEELSSNSVLVVSGNRGKYIPNTSIYVTDTSTYQTTGDQNDITTSFAGEQQITSALDYVTNGNLAKMYVLTGHGEGSLSEYSSTLTTTISNENIETEDLNLVSAGSVPEDASSVLIFAPASDISADEYTALINYAKTGGTLYLLASEIGDQFPNLKKLMAYYNLEPVEGYVVESSSSYYNTYPSFIIPTIEAHTITSPITDNNYQLLIPNTQGAKLLSADDTTTTVEALLQSSDSSYSKKAGANMATFTKEEGDVDGPLIISAAVTKTISAEEADQKETVEATTSNMETLPAQNQTTTAQSETASEGETSKEGETALEGETTKEGETVPEDETTKEGETTSSSGEPATSKLVYMGSTYFITAQFNSAVSGANEDFFMNSLEWLTEKTSSISIRSKDLTNPRLTVSSGQGAFWDLLLMGVIPVVVLAAGGVVCYKRRRR